MNLGDPTPRRSARASRPARLWTDWLTRADDQAGSSAVEPGTPGRARGDHQGRLAPAAVALPLGLRLAAALAADRPDASVAGPGRRAGNADPGRYRVRGDPAIAPADRGSRFMPAFAEHLNHPASTELVAP